jgi:drug/metabolite transporter (DMT)-like permease
MAEAINPVLLYVLMAAMVLSGATLGVVLKLQNNVKVGEYYFEHPFFQCLTMFVGESLCIWMYLIEKRYLKKKYGSVEASPGMQHAIKNNMKTKINPLLLAIPMSCDAAASTLLLIGYLNIPASIAQMMGGFVVFVVAIFSIIFLKRRFFRHHWLGLSLVFTGICLVAASALVEKGGDEKGNATLGVIMMVGSILVQGCQYIVEEKLLGDYYLSPMKAVGWEGITGTILFLIILPILQFIPCDGGICNHGRVENTHQALTMLTKSAPLVIFLILNIIFVAGMNGLGMVVTKYASAANRVVLQQSKVVIVWVFFLFYQGGGHENFKWLQFAGFIVLLLGVLLYNEVFEIPIMGFNQYTRAAIKRRQLNRASVISEYEPEMQAIMETQPLNRTDGDPSDEPLLETVAAEYISPKGYDSNRTKDRLANHMQHSTKAETQDLSDEPKTT